MEGKAAVDLLQRKAAIGREEEAAAAAAESELSARERRSRTLSLRLLLERESYESRTLSLCLTQIDECVVGMGSDCWRQS